MNQSISFISVNSGFSDQQPSTVFKNKQYYLAKSIETHPELIQQIFETDKLITSNNIFHPVNLTIAKLDPNIGPKFEKNKIITRSIVGKPDIFKKKKQQNNTEQFMPTQQSSIGDLQKKTTTSPFHRRMTQNKITNSPIKISKNKKDEKTISGFELQNKVQQLEKRLIQCRIEEEQNYQKLPFQKKQILYKESRALDDYEKLDSLQTHLMYSLSTRVKRDPQNSVMMDLYRFRKQQEYSSTNEKMRVNSELKNSKIFQIIEENKVPYFITSERQEIIRKPKIIAKNDSIQSLLNDDIAFNSFTTNKILQEKSEFYSPLVQNKIETNLDELVVIGKSQYEKEIKFDPNNKYIYKEIEQQQQGDQEL